MCLEKNKKNTQKKSWSFLLRPQLSKLVARVYLSRAWPTKWKQNPTKWIQCEASSQEAEANVQRLNPWGREQFTEDRHGNHEAVAEGTHNHDMGKMSRSRGPLTWEEKAWGAGELVSHT